MIGRIVTNAKMEGIMNNKRNILNGHDYDLTRVGYATINLISSDKTYEEKVIYLLSDGVLDKDIAIIKNTYGNTVWAVCVNSNKDYKVAHFLDIDEGWKAFYAMDEALYDSWFNSFTKYKILDIQISESTDMSHVTEYELRAIYDKADYYFEYINRIFLNKADRDKMVIRLKEFMKNDIK